MDSMKTIPTTGAINNTGTMNAEIRLPAVWKGWTVMRLLGAGSYGRVYEIRREQYGVEERAAAKVISFPTDMDEVHEYMLSGYVEETLAAKYRQQVEDVLKEYSLLMELSSDPHIVHCSTYEAVPREDGIGWDVFIRMELLTPLKRYLGKTITPEQTVELGTSMCSALNTCWKKKVLHRDIKPENILVSPDGVYKLSDFGEAKMVEKSMASGLAGTWSFVAPEVARGERYGETADIYSLGMVLYWMLNERVLPFMSKPWIETTVAEQEEARKRRLNGEPLPPPANGNPMLKNVVLKACAFHPEDRYATPEELSRALEKALQGEVVLESGVKGKKAAPVADEPGDGSIGCSWAAPKYDWGEPSFPEEKVDPTIPADGSMPKKEAPRQDSAPRKGNDLYREAVITAAQAESGCRVTVEGFGGKKLEVTVPAHSQNGKTLRCTGRGYPSYSGGESGDLYINVRVVESGATDSHETAAHTADSSQSAKPAAEAPKKKKTWKSLLLGALTFAVASMIAKNIIIPSYTKDKGDDDADGITYTDAEEAYFAENGLTMNGYYFGGNVVFDSMCRYNAEDGSDYSLIDGMWQVDRESDVTENGTRTLSFVASFIPLGDASLSELFESWNYLGCASLLFDYYTGEWLPASTGESEHSIKWNGSYYYIKISFSENTTNIAYIQRYTISVPEDYDGLVFVECALPRTFDKYQGWGAIQPYAKLMDVAGVRPYDNMYVPLLSEALRSTD